MDAGDGDCPGWRSLFTDNRPFLQSRQGSGTASREGEGLGFDRKGDGFGPGEGVGVVVLKRLRDALADGDYVHGVIAGSAVNQNGSSNGMIRAKALAQEQLE